MGGIGAAARVIKGFGKVSGVRLVYFSVASYFLLLAVHLVFAALEHVGIERACRGHHVFADGLLLGEDWEYRPRARKAWTPALCVSSFSFLCERQAVDGFAFEGFVGSRYWRVVSISLWPISFWTVTMSKLRVPLGSMRGLTCPEQ
jgi:hypothetical protein